MHERREVVEVRCACQQRNQNTRQHGEHDTGVGNRVWQNHMFCIDEDESNYRSSKDQIEWQRGTYSLSPGDKDEQDRCEQFNGGIARRDSRAATATLSSQNDVTDYWDVVVEGDRRST